MKRFLSIALALVMLVACFSTGAFAMQTYQSAAPTAAGVRHDKLPDHMVVGYWHNFCNGSSNLKLRDVPSYYDLVCIAFTENTAVGGRGAFSVDPDLAVALGGYTKEELIQDVKLLQARGQHVIISVGGALGRISIRNEQEAQNFAESMTAIIREYGLEGIDIDLEGGSVSATAYIASSLRTMHNTFGEDFIITMAPETAYIEGESGPYSQLLMEVKDILTVVFPQFYNTGCMTGYDGQMVNRGTADMMTSMSTTLIERYGLRDDQIAFGVPNTQKSAGGGFYTYAETKKAVTAFMNGTRANRFKAPRAYPNFRGMMAWSVNWDNTQNYSWAKSMSLLMDEVSGLAPVSAPKAAPNVQIQAGEQRVKLSWNRVPGAESYEIYDCTSGQKLIMNTSCDFYVVPNLKNGQNYKFMVKAANAAGTGAASAVVSATPEDMPDVYPFYEDWKPTKEYKSGGTRVAYKGNVYENKYYASGSAPDGNDAWKLIGPYLYNGDGFGNGGSSTVPDVPVPETTVPETTVPETTVPETTVPETTVPETTVPETTVPETTVPETTVPETAVPETTVPETTVPETTVPEPTVPETTVPDVTVPGDVKDWKEYTGYAKGDVIAYSGKVYVCNMAHTSLPGWEPANVPALWAVYQGETPTDPVGPTDPKPLPGDTWDAGKVYNGGEVVTYQGKKFSAKWWTRGEEPDASNPWGVWKPL